MAVVLRKTGDNSCDWTYQNGASNPSWPPSVLPTLTQVDFQQLYDGRIKAFLTATYEADGEKSAGLVFAEAAAAAGLSGRINTNETAAGIVFRLGDDGRPVAVWYWPPSTSDHTPLTIHISLPYSAAA